MAVVDQTRTVDGGKYEPSLNSSKMKKRALLLVLLINSGTQRRKYARCSLCFISSAGCSYERKAPPVCRLLRLQAVFFSLFFVICVCHHRDDDLRTNGESFHECLALGQIVHLGGAFGEFFEDFLFFVIQPLEKIVLMPNHQR